MSKVRFRTMTGCALALALLAGRAGAQDQWQQQVENQLQRAASITATGGYVQTHGPWIGSLRAGETTSLSITLESGVQYRIVGVCDNDCSDIDLRLTGDGRMIVQDVASDDVPVLSITPDVTREYSLEIVMVTCTVDPCRYGVASYGRGSDTESARASFDTMDRWEKEVINQLARAANLSGTSGYVQTHGPWVASLRQGERRSWTVRLNGGSTYRFVGVCDTDCSDVDLKLYEGDSVAAQDILVDDVPILTFTPSATRDYRLEAIMASCSANPCRYGVAVFGQ